MKHRFTYKEPSGTWGVHGEEFKNMSNTMYGAMCKLLDYEETGLSPDEVERIQSQFEQVHIGQKIGGYEVFGMFNGYCIAFNRKVPEPYVVWTIDDDKCGVHGGRYRKTKEEAVSVFAEYAFGIELPEPEQTALPKMPNGTALERMRNCRHDFDIPKSVYTDDENTERIRTAQEKIQAIRKAIRRH